MESIEYHRGRSEVAISLLNQAFKLIESFVEFNQNFIEKFNTIKQKRNDFANFKQSFDLNEFLNLSQNQEVQRSCNLNGENYMQQNKSEIDIAKEKNRLDKSARKNSIQVCELNTFDSKFKTNNKHRKSINKVKLKQTNIVNQNKNEFEEAKQKLQYSIQKHNCNETNNEQVSVNIKESNKIKSDLNFTDNDLNINRTELDNAREKLNILMKLHQNDEIETNESINLFNNKINKDKLKSNNFFSNRSVQLADSSNDGSKKIKKNLFCDHSLSSAFFENSTNNLKSSVNISGKKAFEELK